MSVTYNKHQVFVQNLGRAVHNFTSDSTCTVTVYLTTNANAPVATNSILGDLTTISYTNLSSRVVTGITWTHTTGTAHMTATDLVLTASAAVPTFRWVGLYDDDPTSPADPLIGYYDYASDITLAANETLTIDFATDILTVT